MFYSKQFYFRYPKFRD